MADDSNDINDPSFVAARYAETAMLYALASTHPDPPQLLRDFLAYVNQFSGNLEQAPRVQAALRKHADSMLEHIHAA